MCTNRISSILTRSLAILCVFWFVTQPSAEVFASNGDASMEVAKPLKKHAQSTFGVYITSIYAINFHEKTFDVSFWAWWLASDPEYKPYKTVEVSNARKVAVKHSFSEMLGKKKRSEASFTATVNQDWDVRHFPFDKQRLRIVLEDANLPTDSLVFYPDHKNSRLDPAVEFEGWQIMNFQIVSGESQNETNFGDPDADSITRYSNISVLIDLKRHGWRLFFNLFVGIFIAGFLSIIMYFVGLNEIEARIGLILASIFAMVGNKYILDSFLPVTSEVTLSDKLQGITFGMIIIATISNTLTKGLLNNHARLAYTINVAIGGVSTVLYIFFSVYFVLMSINLPQLL